MNSTSSRPLGDQTTLIDLVDRDEMDDALFPLDATQSWFTRMASRRTLPFTPVLQEFITKGSLDFGHKFVFEIGSVNAGDLLFGVSLQIRLGHWLSPDIVTSLQSGSLTYTNPQDAWYYANSLGTILIQKAELIVEDQVLETVDGDFANISNHLLWDLNTQVGLATDALGTVQTMSDTQVFPTTNGFITCILPFSFQRVRLQNGFPLISCREKTVRIEVTLRPFSECIRGPGVSPLGQTFQFSRGVTVTASSIPPPFLDARLVTYGMMTDGKLRTALLKAPFERLYREVQSFRFDEPKKYVINTGPGMVRLQLPLEVNGPIEEIIWIIRRKNIGNDWTNYGGAMLDYASLQVNGTTLIEATGDYFRRNIAKAHKGGITAYNSFIYGYTFAQKFQHTPSGWINASRSTDIRLRIDVNEETEFEVLVYSIALNWVRFENGIANKLFSS